MQKEQRQSRIVTLIGTRRIKKQEELASLLLAEGFHVTQSSISRDLIDLGIVKVGGRYAIPSRPRTQPGVGFTSVTPAGENLIVAKCETGMASAVCVRLDAAKLEGVIGTIAGEDTIFVAVADKNSQRSVIKALLKLFEN